MSDLLLIPVAPEHYTAVAAIYNEYILAGNVTMEESAYDEQRIANWIKGFSSREKMLVLVKDAATIGWGVIKKYSDREGYKTTCETSVYLTSTECNKGYGSIIKAELIKECKQLGYHHLVAKIWAGNTTSIEYNKKFGYTEVGVQKEVGYKNGKWVDVVIMQCLLD